MRTVVIGFLGTTLDRGGQNRWDPWRSSVDLCRHEDLVVGRFELLSQVRSRGLANEVTADILSVSPETEVRTHDLEFRDPWDFEEVYGALLDFARAYPFKPDEESYLVHMTTGTHVAQICLFLLAESREIPGRLIQMSPPPPAPRRGAGHVRDHRPRPVQVRPAGLAIPGAASRGPLVSQVRHRHSQRRVQQAHRADRAGGHRLTVAPAPHGPDGRGQGAARATDLRAEEGPPPGGRRLR